MTSRLTLITLLLACPITIAQSVENAGRDIRINTKGRFQVDRVDGTASFRIGGRLQWDYNRAEENGSLDEDGLDIRRARLYAQLRTGDWEYKAQFNIGQDNGGTPEDLYIRYRGLPGGWSATLGHQKEPFGLNELVSSKDINMLERGAATEAFAFGRSDGLVVARAAGDTTFSLGVFEDDSDLSTFAFTGRATHALSLDKGSLVHLGAGYSARGGEVNNSGIELAWVVGPLHLQSEYFWSDRAGTNLSGYYLQAGYILTGESLPYSNGVFGRVEPSRASGAWEIVARYESGDGDYGDIELGNTDASALGVGLNYYLNANIRMGINYTEGDDNASGNSGSEWRARMQFAF